jgi:hypothetical protein
MVPPKLLAVPSTISMSPSAALPVMQGLDPEAARLSVCRKPQGQDCKETMSEYRAKLSKKFHLSEFLQ